MNASLRERMVPLGLQRGTLPFPVFLGKIDENIVSLQLQRILEEMVHLDPFHLGFKLRGNAKITLIILVYDLW